MWPRSTPRTSSTSPWPDPTCASTTTTPARSCGRPPASTWPASRGVPTTWCAQSAMSPSCAGGPSSTTWRSPPRPSAPPWSALLAPCSPTCPTAGPPRCTAAPTTLTWPGVWTCRPRPTRVLRASWACWQQGYGTVGSARPRSGPASPPTCPTYRRPRRPSPWSNASARSWRSTYRAPTSRSRLRPTCARSPSWSPRMTAPWSTSSSWKPTSMRRPPTTEVEDFLRNQPGT